MATENKTAEFQARLDAAIEAAGAAVTGAWKSSVGEGYIQLVWTCDASDEALADMYGDEPWSDWGGDAILSAAGLPEYDNSGADTYTDRFGDEMVAQWVEWNIEE